MSRKEGGTIATDSSGRVTRSDPGDLIPGDVVRVFFRHVRPKLDSRGNVIENGKERPGLVIYRERNQIVVAYISSVPRILLDPADISVPESSPSFDSTGLEMSSTIKLGVLSTVKLNDVVGFYGSVDEALRAEINAKLATCFRI